MLKKLSLLILAAGMSLMAAPIVHNGFFNDGDMTNGKVPEGWTSENNNAVWEFVDYDGVGDAASVRFKATGANGRLVQKVALEANSDYSLVFWYKNTGIIPSVALYDAATAESGKELAQFKAPAGKDLGWTYARVDFRSTAAKEYLLALNGDADGKGAGSASFDGIEIITRAEADKRPAPSANTEKKDNIALHKKYTLINRPDYIYCSDPGDATQLTDGVKTNGYFWTQKSTVGWHHTKPGIFVIDLGAVEPICGASWSCAASKLPGVVWPNTIQMMVSDDQENWNMMGDLIQYCARSTTLPEDGEYRTFTYSTREMKGCGRYVAFIGTSPSSSAIFCDEVEVYRGDETCRTSPVYYGKQKCKIEDLRKNIPLYDNLHRLLDAQTTDFIAKINEMPDKFAGKAAALALSEELSKEVAAMSYAMPKITRFELPLAEYPLATRIYLLNAYIQQSMGYKKPFAWKSNRWENMTFAENAPKGASSPKLSVMMMRGEVRADAFSVANPTLEDIEVGVETADFKEGLNVQLKRVAVTVTRDGELISSALLPIDGTVKVPAGCNVQFWVSCYKPEAKPGKYNGKIKISGAVKQTIPMTVEIVNLPEFTKDPVFNVGGWEYAGNGAYNNNNRKENIEFMREIGVNCTWTTTWVLPTKPVFDAEGKLTNFNELNFSNFDAWIAQWPGAHYYCVANFMDRKIFFGEPVNTPRYVRMACDYFKAIETHVASLGIKPEQFVLLYHDEPYSKEGDKIVADFLKAIRTTEFKMQFFQDPTWREPWNGIPEAFSLCDILCPNTPMMTDCGDKFKEFYAKQRDDGRTLWLYSCSGPAKCLDPLDYWRGQAWQCQMMKAHAGFFWAFGCCGGGQDSWDSFAMRFTEFGPYFVNKSGMPDDSKQAEGIRESVQDFEYMKMLEAEIARVKAIKPQHRALADAEIVMAEAPAEVVASIKPNEFKWKRGKDAGLMDRNAQKILKALEKLSTIK